MVKDSPSNSLAASLSFSKWRRFFTKLTSLLDSQELTLQNRSAEGLRKMDTHCSLSYEFCNIKEGEEGIMLDTTQHNTQKVCKRKANTGPYCQYWMVKILGVRVPAAEVLLS